MILITDPEWTEEYGGTVITYIESTSDSPAIVNEETKDSNINIFLTDLEKEVGDIHLISSKIISLGNYDAFEIIFTFHIASTDVETTTIMIADGYRIYLFSHGYEVGGAPDKTFNEVITSFKIKNPQGYPTDYVKPDLVGFFGEIFGVIIICAFIAQAVFKTSKKQKLPYISYIGLYMFSFVISSFMMGITEFLHLAGENSPLPLSLTGLLISGIFYMYMFMTIGYIVSWVFKRRNVSKDVYAWRGVCIYCILLGVPFIIPNIFIALIFGAIGYVAFTEFTGWKQVDD